MRSIILLLGLVVLNYCKPKSNKILFLVAEECGAHLQSAKAVMGAIDRLSESTIEFIIMPTVRPSFASFYGKIVQNNYIATVVICDWFYHYLVRWWRHKLPMDCDTKVSELLSRGDISMTACNFARPIEVVRRLCGRFKIPFLMIPGDIDESYTGVLIRKPEFAVYFCGSPYLQAKTRSYPNSIGTSGMVLRDEFRYIREISKKDMKINLGLDPNKRVVLITFGSLGSKYMLEMAEIFKNDTSKYYIFICGIADNLKKKIDAMNCKHFITTGYISNVHEYTRAADVMIGKPGPGSVSECVQCQTPVILKDTWWDVLPQEKHTIRWVKENRYGVIIKNYKRDLTDAITKALEIDTPEWPVNNATDETAYAIVQMLKNIREYKTRLDKS